MAAEGEGVARAGDGSVHDATGLANAPVVLMVTVVVVPVTGGPPHVGNAATASRMPIAVRLMMCTV